MRFLEEQQEGKPHTLRVMEWANRVKSLGDLWSHHTSLGLPYPDFWLERVRVLMPL